MPASEIDDIFAAKGKVNPTPSTSKLPDPASNKEKKQKKRKRAAQVQADQQPPIRTAPETVIDPSLRLSVPTKQRAKPEADDQPEKKRRKSQKEDEERFKDSRGTGPRRKTEEGFSIYKEDELGITDHAGETPLCPFDCQCCF